MQKYLTTLALLLVARAAHADAKATALDDMGRAVAPLIARGSGYRDGGFPSGAASKEMLELGYACLSKVAPAKAAGATGKDTVIIVVDGKRHDGKVTWKVTKDANAWTYETNLYEARQYCHAWVQTGALDNLRDHIYYHAGWNKALDGLELTDDGLEARSRAEGAQRMLEQAQECTKKVAEAVIAELPPETVVEIHKVSVKLGEVQDQICSPVATAAQAKIAAFQAVVEQAMAPFRKALKGDKLDTWEEAFNLDAYASGIGGVDISEPAEYAKASVWFSSHTFESADCPTGRGWQTRKYTFDKKSRLKSTKEKTGCGDHAPTSAYR